MAIALLLHDDGIWSYATSNSCYRNQFLCVLPESELQVASAYRTVFQPSILKSLESSPSTIWHTSGRRFYAEDSKKVQEQLNEERIRSVVDWLARPAGRWGWLLIITVAERKRGEISVVRLRDILIDHIIYCNKYNIYFLFERVRLWACVCVHVCVMFTLFSIFKITFVYILFALIHDDQQYCSIYINVFNLMFSKIWKRVISRG